MLQCCSSKMSDRTFELVKIILDRGILALVAVWVVWRLNRALERFKSGQAWEGELAKERLAVSKSLLLDATSVRQAAFGLAPLTTRLPGADDEESGRLRKEYMDAQQRLERSVAEAALTLPDDILKLFGELAVAANEIADNLRFNRGLKIGEPLGRLADKAKQATEALREQIRNPSGAHPTTADSPPG